MVLLELVAVIIVVVVLIGALRRGVDGASTSTSGSAATSAFETPWSTSIATMPPPASRAARAAFAALGDIERGLGSATTPEGAPTVAALQADLIQPLDRPGALRLIVGETVAYAVPVDELGWLLLTFQPTSPTADGAPDSTHHRLRDGRFVHATVWWRAETSAPGALEVGAPLAAAFREVRP